MIPKDQKCCCNMLKRCCNYKYKLNDTVINIYSNKAALNLPLTLNKGSKNVYITKAATMFINRKSSQKFVIQLSKTG